MIGVCRESYAGYFRIRWLAPFLLGDIEGYVFSGYYPREQDRYGLPIELFSTCVSVQM